MASGGLFVAFEGGEGAGKSTQTALLRDWLVAEGRSVCVTHEPGDTAVGQRLREILLGPETGELAPRTEALLYAADRAEHVATVFDRPSTGVRLSSPTDTSTRRWPTKALVGRFPLMTSSGSPNGPPVG